MCPIERFPIEPPRSYLRHECFAKKNVRIRHDDVVTGGATQRSIFCRHLVKGHFRVEAVFAMDLGRNNYRAAIRHALYKFLSERRPIGEWIPLGKKVFE